MSVADKIAKLGIDLSAPSAPAANYVPFIQTGPLVFISGQVPIQEGRLAYRGKVGDEVSQEDAYRAARLCGIGILTQLNAACGGNLDAVGKCIKLGGFVNCTPDFDQHPAVINGASDLMVEVFGDRGRHARFAVGAPSLPFNVAVEVDAVFEIG